MKAMILKEQKSVFDDPLELVDIPTPKPIKNEVLLKVTICGVCHTDLHTVEGDFPLVIRPVIPGHQTVGVVVETGTEVTTLKVGDRVGTAWLYWACGECIYCKNDQENLCENIKFTGLHADGGYAEYMTAPEDFLYKLPEGFSDENAAPLLCAGIIGYRSLRLSEVKTGGKLGLYGFGASAHITIQVARHLGCEVYVFTRGDHHKKLAKELGAIWVGDSNEIAPSELDGAIIFAPAGELVPTALKALRKGGTLALGGIHMSPIPQMNYCLLYGERTIRTVANSTRRDGIELISLAAKISIKTEIEKFHLEEANIVLKKLKERSLRAAAVLSIDGRNDSI